MEPEIKVTQIKNRYHARCFLNGKIVDEMACNEKEDIGVICQIMLRWLNKLSIHVSEYTDRVRYNSEQRNPVGKIWYKNILDEEKKKLNIKKRGE